MIYLLLKTRQSIKQLNQTPGSPKPVIHSAAILASVFCYVLNSRYIKLRGLEALKDKDPTNENVLDAKENASKLII